MPSLIFIKGGLYTSLQDQGRAGLAFYGIPASGAMDKSSSALANLLVGNDEHNPVIEMSIVGATIRFEDECVIALTGAHMECNLDDKNIQINRAHVIKKGQVLECKMAQEGVRSYMAINGLISESKSYNSYSSYLYAGLGANKGKKYSNNDCLNYDYNQSPTLLNIESSAIRINKEVLISRGPEFKYLTDDSKKKLIHEEFRLSPHSNRMGATIEGPILNTIDISMQSSVPLLPGFIQLLPSGKANIVLQDGQTTGGYPRIAYVSRSDLNNFNQINFNTAFKFKLK